MPKKIILLIFLFAVTNSCTRDDICSEATPVTPKLVIAFKNIINPVLSKQVVGLSVETDELNSVNVIPETTTDSIGIPLKTTSDTTRYRFIKRINDTVVNIDRITFVAQRSEVYINRACGYKTVYRNLSATLENEGDENWILGIEILNQTVENENQAHLTIRH